MNWKITNSLLTNATDTGESHSVLLAFHFVLIELSFQGYISLFKP